MSRRTLVALVLAALMALFGTGVYWELGTMRSHAFSPSVNPTRSQALVKLPGSVYLAQGGVLYVLRNGKFKLLDSGGWTQPAVSPDHSQLVAVRRVGFYSDLYLLDLNGHVLRQLTHNGFVFFAHNHWSFYPRFSADGHSVFYAWDPKDPVNSYRVDLAIYEQSLAGAQSSARQWTTPNQYTGGDVQPVPLASGGLLYTKFAIGSDGHDYSQVWLQRSSGTAGVALTTPADNCSEPALSPDERWLALVCESAQASRLVLASFDQQRLGPLTEVVTGSLCASPSWAADGSALVYFAPAGAAGHFELFTLPTRGLPALNLNTFRARPKQITTDIDLDATSAAAWT